MPTKGKKSKPINSMERLQRRLPVILEALNDDPALFMAAAANPILAIEEVGYSITDEFRLSLERHLRFSESIRRRLEETADEIFEAAGCRFDLADEKEIDRVLFDELRVPRPADSGEFAAHEKSAKAARPSSAELTTLPRPGVFGREFKDPLAAVEDAHPVVRPLLEYRQLEASETRFASRVLYKKIRRGQVELPIKRLRLRYGADRNQPGDR